MAVSGQWCTLQVGLHVNAIDLVLLTAWPQVSREAWYKEKSPVICTFVTHGVYYILKVLGDGKNRI